MKTIVTVSFLFLVGFCANAQNITNITDLSKTFDDYVKDYKKTDSVDSQYRRLNTAEKIAKRDGKDSVYFAYNPKMFNKLVADNIGSYVTSSSDFTLQKWYAVLESSDGSLFLGTNINWNRKEEIDPIKHVTTIGLKAKTDENFTTLYADGKMASQLGMNLKQTFFFKPKIKYYGSHKTHVETYRESVLRKKYSDDLKKYADENDNNTETEGIIKSLGLTPKDEDYKDIIQEKYVELYTKIAEDEEKFINDNRQFNSIRAHWVSVETYIPFTAREYQLSPALSDSTVIEKKFYDFRVGLTYTWMKKWSNRKTLYVSGSASHYKINNIMTEELKKRHYYDYIVQLPSDDFSKIAIADDREVYVGNYFQQNTQSFKAELIYFFIKDYLGVSASFAKTLGRYESQNWKLGIPLSLKDKDGKQTVNFEAVWKESYGKHIIGLSIGYTFGNFVK